MGFTPEGSTIERRWEEDFRAVQRPVRPAALATI